MNSRTERDAIGEIGVVEFQGREFKARGATITPEFAVAYLGGNVHDRLGEGDLKDWSGNKIGTWKKTGAWFVSAPRSRHIRTSIYQIEAVINGVTYTGKSQGLGMIWKGKAKRT